jgi:hypothetical protein
MANQKITELGANTNPAGAVLIPIVTDPSGTPVTEKTTKSDFLKSEYSLVSEASSATPTATATALRNEYVATALVDNAELQLPSGTARDNCLVLYNLKASGGTRTITRVSGLTAGGKTRAGTIATGETLLELYKRVGTTYVCVDSQVIPA